MRRITIGALLAFCVLLAGGLAASAQIGAKVTLPFAFQVEDTLFPAGTYQFSQPNPDAKLTIRGKKDGTFATASLPPESVFEKDKTWLVFRRYKDRYFLAEIWSHHIGRQFTFSASEKSLQQEGQQGTEVRVNVKT